MSEGISVEMFQALQQEGAEIIEISRHGTVLAVAWTSGDGFFDKLRIKIIGDGFCPLERCRIAASSSKRVFDRHRQKASEAKG